MILTMVWIMPARAQHPFTLTTTDDVTNGTQHYYLIQSIDRPTFYAIPHSNDESSKVSTTSIPNANMPWYFMDAGSDSDHQYYYIVNSTGRCLYRYDNNHDGIQIKNTYAELSSLSDDELNKYKFYLTQTGSDYFIQPKGASNLYLNKRGGNVPYGNGYYFKSSTYSDEPSKWNFVAVGDVTWPQPFITSTNVNKHYYKFQNVTNTSFYLSNSEEWATLSSTESNEDVWYILDAGTDATYSNCHYYYIVNAITEKYLYYTGGTGNDVATVMDYDSSEDNNYRFLIVDAAYKTNNNYATGYTIVPKLRQTCFSDKDSFAPMAMNDGSHLLLKSDRGSGNYASHWEIVETVYALVEAPTITNNYDGTISLSTTTPDATIYYTINGDTPDNTSTEYSLPFSLGDATVIKAIACKGSDESVVTTYNVPKYTTPIISFDNSTHEVTITCTGATGIYYTTDGSTPTTSSTSYSVPFTVTSGTAVKAIATHPGYLNSDVATKYILGNDYPQNYLTFNVLTDGTICWKAFGSVAKEISYRINGGSWTDITSTSAGATINVYEDDVVEFKGSNETYATSKSAYSGFEGGTATFDIEGNIHSLLYGDDFANNNSLTNSTYQFCSLFKKAPVISAENLVLPATTLKDYCYRALFSWCTTLTTPPVLPATTLATGCYWYMFEQCAISSAPELNATTLVKECYGHMFENCPNLNYIKCVATSGFDKSNCLLNWVLGVPSPGTFVNEPIPAWTLGASGIPSGWTYNAYLFSPEISCDGVSITITCATEEADIYYRLNQTGNFSLYSSPIVVNSTTTVEAYSSKGDIISNTVIYTFEIFDNPFDESTRSINSWTYANAQVTLPYSVNGIDGHSSSYSQGTHAFETTITIYSLQPTYLWFQHADQSADIYVDNTFVTTHWGGYNAFFVDITDYVQIGTNKIKVILNNKTRNALAPCAGDFNFNATLGKVKILTSPVLPSMDYGYDGMHITSSVTDASATINIKTSIPEGASVVCKIDADDENYHFTETKPSTGSEITFTTTISNPHLWNGTEDPFLYNVTLEIYHNNELYHRYQRPYGFRYYNYVINEPINNENYTGFLLNGQPYLLRGVCMHDDLEGKANALNDDDYAQEFDIIQELGCNFLRLAHYPHPKEVYDKCDQLGIIVQTEAPWVNKSTIDETEDYWTHLEGQCADMVNQHYNHPCIMFWGVGNEINTSYTNTTEGKDFVKGKIEGYRNIIRTLLPGAMVGYTISHNTSDLLGVFNSPTVDWVGGNIYVGWYIQTDSNNPTNELDKRIAKTITNANVPCAFSEYGCGGTQSCHSEAPRTTTTRGTNQPRHDIEYQMWLHEGHIAAIKNKPELLFTSQWQLFDIAVWNRQEGYKVCFDGGETVFENNELKFLNNKGLVERDHVTKKDPFYLYKAWWNQTDKFVHICGKDYKKLTDRVIKCYTNDGIITDNDTILRLFVNDVVIDTATVVDNIATFEARDFSPGDVIRVEGATTNGATTNDTFTFTNYNNNNVFTTAGNWNEGSNWSGNTVPADGSDVVIMANATVPSGYTANADNIDLYGGSLTFADGGQLYHNNEGVIATVQKTIAARSTEGNVNKGWAFIASPVTTNVSPTSVSNMTGTAFDLYRFNQNATLEWENYLVHNTTDNPFLLENGQGYLYNNESSVTLGFDGAIQPSNIPVSVSIDSIAGNELAGWNLVGNPFTCNAVVDRPYYKMNEDGSAILATEQTSGTIAPCTGIMVHVGETGQSVTFSKEPPTTTPSNGNVSITVVQANERGASSTTIDNAIVSFSKGSELPKFYFGNTNAKLYIPQGNKEFAIACAEAQGEIPLNFRANENGQYTISVNPENVEMNYLHLIDNMSGADVDLLTSPSYTFTAKMTDYESRFKLVFSSNDEDGASSGQEAFAFFSNGSWIIANESQATLQVIDLTGRILSNETINGYVRKAIQAAPGMYVLRLISGNDVKTQKVVIE